MDSGKEEIDEDLTFLTSLNLKNDIFLHFGDCLHQTGIIVQPTRLMNLLNMIVPFMAYLPRNSPTMPTGSLAFTGPQSPSGSSPESYSFFPASLKHCTWRTIAKQYPSS